MIVTHDQYCIQLCQLVRYDVDPSKIPLERNVFI